MDSNSQLEMVNRIKQARKYRSICDDTLYRVVDWAALRYGTPREVLKASKRKLHQVYGAYLDQVSFSEIEGLVDTLSAGTSEEDLRTVCRKILRCHASTAERIPVMQDLYAGLFRETGRPETVLDLACGLNPFALPWMSLDGDTTYHAEDMDHRLVSIANRLLARLGRPQTVQCRDILVSKPEMEADVVLLLKALPCLERQEKGISLELLRSLRTRCVVASFPVETLGGRDKGMVRHYDSFMTGLVDQLAATMHKMEHPNEVLYVLRMGDP